MLFATLLPLVDTTDIEHLDWDFTGRVTDAMADQNFLGDIIDSQAWIRETVPVKYLSTTALLIPSASKIWAPW